MLDEWIPDLTEAVKVRIVIVDGTLTPCWSWAPMWKACGPGKHKTTGHSHQVLVCSTGPLLHISDPVPGARHDARAVAEAGLLEILDLGNTIGDKEYVGTGIGTP